MEGQHAIRGQVDLRSMGFSEIPIVNVENACAGGATALHQAAMMLRAGLTDVALAIGVEKMHSDDKLKSSAIFDGGWDVHDLDAIAERLTARSAERSVGKEGVRKCRSRWSPYHKNKIKANI